ncbi:hypothetical protein HDU91_001070 [Kappamyces sp. JEL0680]|nr:hypothetical protein HDU91_001070 [Kappamyces sp. JEL0680]
MEDIPRVDYHAPPEIEQLPASVTVPYAESLGRSPSPERQPTPVAATNPPFPTSMDELSQDRVFASAATLTGFDSASSFGDRPPSPAKAQTLNSRKLAPLKSFVGSSRAATARRPLVKGPSPASLKQMTSSFPAPLTAAPSIIVEGQGARKLDAFRDAFDEGVERIDLSVELDKLVSLTQME